MPGTSIHRIYDCFMFFNEIELLELRLKTLSAVVDFFVLAEINITHNGKDKIFFFDYFKDQFRDYKIIHIKANLAPNDDAWVTENAHRNLLFEGFKNADPEDYIMISDADEIPNPKAVLTGIEAGYEKFGLCQDLFCFYVNCKANQMWNGTVVAKRKLITAPQYLRNERNGQDYRITDGGWHYSSMGGKERIRTKFTSFAETDFNKPSYLSDENLDLCLETGKDLTNRTDHFAQKRFLRADEITHPQVFDWAEKYPNFIKL